jgi:hypothetical protein
VMVDSRDDPRVQVADLLAGVPRRLPEIVDDRPLQPFLSATSLRDPPAGFGVERGRTARMTLPNRNICVRPPVAAAGLWPQNIRHRSRDHFRAHPA